MRILFSSYAFRPALGGIETVSEILAGEFVAAGHEVELITETAGEAPPDHACPITRRPGLSQTASLLRWADLFFQNNISLRTLLPALLMRKRCVVVHQTWLRNPRGEIGWNDRLKRGLLPRVTNVAISRAIAGDLKQPCRIIPNPYRDDLFRIIPGIARHKSLVFVGRLVSDKGVDLLLRALHRLRQNQLAPGLTIIGSGPEEGNLRSLAGDLGLRDQIAFAGAQSGQALARILNEHRILVIPSRWAEPFGIVALEGIACGCAAIGSAAGGLKEAMGPCGITFENGDENSLAGALKDLLCHPQSEDSLRRAAPTHLARFQARAVAQIYLALLEEAMR